MHSRRTRINKGCKSIHTVTPPERVSKTNVQSIAQDLRNCKEGLGRVNREVWSYEESKRQGMPCPLRLVAAHDWLVNRGLAILDELEFFAVAAHFVKVNACDGEAFKRRTGVRVGF